MLRIPHTQLLMMMVKIYILHLAAAITSRKEMVQNILKNCLKIYKGKILEKQDIRGNTPLHLLISYDCFIPELLKHEGLDIMAKTIMILYLGHVVF